MKVTGLSLAVPFAAVVIPLLVSSPNAAPRYSSWGEPENLGPTINSSYTETAPTLSKDGLSLYFSSTRPCGENDAVLDVNIWVARRFSRETP